MLRVNCYTSFVFFIFWSFNTTTCLVPRRLSFDENLRAKEGGKETTGVCTLPMVPCGSSPVTRFALASAMRKTKRLRRRLNHYNVTVIFCVSMANFSVKANLRLQRDQKQKHIPSSHNNVHFQISCPWTKLSRNDVVS